MIPPHPGIRLQELTPGIDLTRTEVENHGPIIPVLALREASAMAVKPVSRTIIGPNEESKHPIRMKTGSGFNKAAHNNLGQLNLGNKKRSNNFA